MRAVEDRSGRGGTDRSLGRIGAVLLQGSFLLAGVQSLAAAEAIPGRPIGLDPRLAAGVEVEVKGRFLGDGSFLAERIEVNRERKQGEELRGVIESVDPKARRLKILGFTVEVGPEARLSREPDQPATFEDLTSGLRVKVDGSRSAEGVFVAKKIRIRQEQYSERKIIGPVDAVARSGVGRAVLWVLGLPVMVNGATGLVAENGPTRPAVSLGFGDADEDDLLITGRNQMGNHLALLGELRLRGEVQSNTDLDPSSADRKTVPALFGTVGLVAGSETFLAYVEAIGEHEHAFRGDGSTKYESGDVRGGQAYIGIADCPARGLSLEIGRQKFFESRRWYYDNKNLDAIRLFGNYGPVTFQASISRDLFDQTRNLRDRDTTNRIAELNWDLKRNLALRAFYLDREDRTELQDSPRILGVRFLGDPGVHLEFWADLAYEGGTRGHLDSLTGEVVVREVRAHALDVGLTYRPRVAWDPSFTASFALGSGDDEPALPAGEPQGADGTFRQSGFQRNRGSLNGVVSFRYYGEALDPELTNVRIETLAVGLRPAPPFSLDLVLHSYRQDVPSPRIENAELDIDPSGLDPRLGKEWDLILGYEPLKAVEFRLTGGYFQPGRAFPDNATASTVATFQVRLRL